jgi:small subunit ribosomal protein S23e
LGFGEQEDTGYGSRAEAQESPPSPEVADKSYKKSHQGNEWKKPFAGSSHAKGIVLEKM